jgi:glycosyltransferase involved in cell wall biosynthesis
MDSVFSNLEALIKEAGLAPPLTKKRFMLVGTHAHQTTGYSKVTHHIIQELAKYAFLDIFHFAIQKFMVSPPEYRRYPGGVQVYDTMDAERTKTAPQEMGFGFSQIAEYVRLVKPDVVMIYNDAGVICQYLDKLNALSAEERRYKLIIYLDQVYEIQRPDYLKRIDACADIYFAFTAHWKKVLEKQGIKKPIHVLRHGFNPEQFKPLDRVAMRRKHGIPEHLFIFLNLNRNTPRKRHDIVVQAFAELVARHPTKPLALLAVCDNGETGGYSLQEIYLRTLDSLKVPLQFHANKLMISKTTMTYTDELINELYALSDVGITAAEGEGFGLCQFEAMGVGIPQIVPNIGGFLDFCNVENSMLVAPRWKNYMANSHSSIGGIAEIVDPHEVMLAAEEYVMDTELREKHGAAAREAVLKYNWSNEVARLADVLGAVGYDHQAPQP